MRSRIERLADTAIDFGRCYESNKEYTTVQELVNGRILNVSKIVSIEPRDNFKDITCDDYCLENIIAAGATGQLREVHGTYDSFAVRDGVISNMEDALDALEEIK